MAKSMRTRASACVAAVGVLVVGALAGCGASTTTPPNAQDQAQQRAQDRVNYVPKNDVEGNNYNARLAIADDPTTIIWCTVYPTNQNVKAFTVPIAGKLTSGNKRPYPTTREAAGGLDGYIADDYYTPEVPGPDGMYGSSGEYRYGFGPDGVYNDFYNVETYCTSVPTLIQKQTTDIAIANKGGDLADLDRRAQDALKACRAANTDPSVPCDAAANILGVN